MPGRLGEGKAPWKNQSAKTEKKTAKIRERSGREMLGAPDKQENDVVISNKTKRVMHETKQTPKGGS